ncbi:MAG: hypothetical protein V3T23_02590 [Nitrososphaerales archaeon]
MKHFFFRHYWWIAVLALVIVIFLIVSDSQPPDWKIVLTLIGSTISFVFFVQKQKLEELKMFKELFTEFNSRYDNLNDKLLRIPEANPSEELSEEEKITLNDYFNLCGEEYLFYEKGYIDPVVWKAWHNGMRVFFQNSRIRKLWLEELNTDSYYGLRMDN